MGNIIRAVVMGVLLLSTVLLYLYNNTLKAEITTLKYDNLVYSNKLKEQNIKILELQANKPDTSKVDIETNDKLNKKVDNTLENIDKELYEFSKGN